MATIKKKIAKGRHASSMKRDRQAEKLRVRNRQAMSRMRTAIKKARTAKSKEAVAAAVPVIARTAQKGIIHKRTASRLISRLMKSAAAK